MLNLTLTLAAREPLVLTSGSAESMAHTCLDYIPGNMILGAFAAIWKSQNKGIEPDASLEFQNLFLNGSVKWGNGVPLCAGSPCVPVPMSYFRAKSGEDLPLANSGKGQGADIHNFLKTSAKSANDDDGPRPKMKRLEQGFMSAITLNRPNLRHVWNMHVALGQTRAAEDGYLFGYSAVAAGARFQSRIRCGGAAYAALKSMADKLNGEVSIRVGHARSAGCGLVDARLAWTEEPAQAKTAANREFDFFLVSHYLPVPSWENPEKSLLAQIGRLTGHNPEIEKRFTAFVDIPGYNNYWRKPRSARQALAAGSVLRLKFPQAVSMDAAGVLGAGQMEGYGEYLVNPPFLAQEKPAVTPTSPVNKPPRPDIAPNGPDQVLWNLLGERAAARLTRRQALTWLADESWRKFLQDAWELDRPTASQRASVAGMNVETFEAMLAKTPGQQWKEAVCFSPFLNMEDYLSAIMLNLLQDESFFKRFAMAAYWDSLPGASGADEHKTAARQYFIHELFRAWTKGSRSKGNAEQE